MWLSSSGPVGTLVSSSSLGSYSLMFQLRSISLLA
jgi:hypothetical protein